MKLLKSWLLPAAAAVAGAVWAFTPPQNGNPTLICTPLTTVTGGVQISISNLEKLEKDTGRYRVFVVTGDGYYFEKIVYNSQIGSAPIVLDTHYYRQQGSYVAYAEATALYDDTNDPKYTATVTVSPTSGSSNPNAHPISGWARICANRAVVPGDSITYIVTYRNPGSCSGNSVSGSIELTFDPSKLTYQRTGAYFSESTTSTVAAANQNGKITYSYLSLASQRQRNIFFVFKVNENLQSGDTLNPTPTLNFTYSDGSSTGTCSNITLPPMVHNASTNIVNSHDPNSIESDLEKICTKDTVITYTIHFQNEGPGPAHQVIVRDRFDKIFGNTNVRVVGTSHPVFLKDTSYNAVGRSLVVTFGNTTRGQFNLRGVKEKGFGTEFPEEETKGWVRVIVPLKMPQFGTNEYCKTVFNQSEIIFDCNPPMYTNVDVIPLGCASCGDCTTVLDTTISFSTGAGPGDFIPDSLSPSQLAQTLLGSGYTKFRWFPITGLDDPEKLYAGFQVLDNIISNYTLVATNPSSCQQAIVRIPMSYTSCTLGIEVEQAGLAPLPCATSLGGNIYAKAVGGSGKYQWQSCRPGVYDSLKNLAPGTYYLGVTDRNSGCTAEKWVEIKSPPAIRVDDDPNDARADLQISGGGGPPYTIRWTDKNSQTKQTDQMAKIDMSDLGSPEITVTDAMGCSIVFTPMFSQSPGLTTGEILLSVLGFLAAIFGGWLFFKRFRKK